MPANSFLRSLPGLIITISVALSGSLACQAAGVPAPFLLGSLSGVWLVNALLKPFRQELSVPAWLVTLVVLGLGVVIGAIFTPDVLADAARWPVTIIAVAATTVVATASGFFFLTKLRGYDKALAFLCCVPGGQVEVVAMSRLIGEKAHVVAIYHVIRISIVFCSTPLLLAFIYGRDAVDAAGVALQNTSSVAELPVIVNLQFAAIAAAGYACAKLLRFPMPYLLGPLVVSTALHFLGLVDMPRIAEFMLLAQIVIGGSIGAKLARVPVAELKGYVRDALVNAILIISIYAVTAALLSFYTDNSLPNMLLAFIPGGLYEVTLLAFLFGFDIAFVSFHHVLRVLLIYLSLPFIFSKISKNQPRRNQ